MNAPKRTNMKPEERRAQLLDCAQMLFFSKGFEETTMQDILAAAHVSKGGFYHHFKSKDDLLEGILGRFAHQTLMALGPLLEQKFDSWVDLYEAYFDALRRQLADGALTRLPLFLMLLEDKNAALQQRLSDSIHDANASIFAEVLRRGIQSGDLDLPDADVAAGLAIRIGTSHQLLIKKALHAEDQGDLKSISRQIEVSLALQGLTIDRLLSLPDGTTGLRSDGFAVALTKGIEEIKFGGQQ